MLKTRRTILQMGAAAFTARAFASGTDSLKDAPFSAADGWQPLLNGRDLSGWHSELGWHGVAGRTEWYTTTAVSWSDANPKVLTATPAPGGIIVNGVQTHTTNLVADRKFGDIELYVEFMVSKDSNSGVYLHGLYEVQILDSYGKAGPLRYSDGGGIYEQVDKNNKGFGGTPPRVNATKPPGEWQFYHIWFRAPRFDHARRLATRCSRKLSTTASLCTLGSHPAAPPGLRSNCPKRPGIRSCCKGIMGRLRFGTSTSGRCYRSVLCRIKMD
jgi:hypothetical protein